MLSLAFLGVEFSVIFPNVELGLLPPATSTNLALRLTLTVLVDDFIRNVNSRAKYRAHV